MSILKVSQDVNNLSELVNLCQMAKNAAAFIGDVEQKKQIDAEYIELLDRLSASVTKLSNLYREEFEKEYKA
jgi:hypothetical protein